MEWGWLINLAEKIGIDIWQNNPERILRIGRIQNQLSEEKIIGEAKAKVYAEHEANRLKKKLAEAEPEEHPKIIGEIAVINHKIELLTQQQNTINSFIETLKEIEGLPEGKLSEPDNDWLREWSKNAGRFSNDDAYRLWGKVLAGEMKKPGTFSYRVLDGLRNLSKDDANLILKMAPFVTDGLIYRTNDLIFNMGTSWGDWYQLEEIGVVKHVGSVSTSSKSTIVQDTKMYIRGLSHILVLSSSIPKDISEPIIILTELGSAILSLIKPTFIEDINLTHKQEEYMIQLGNYLEKQYQVHCYVIKMTSN
ncbi:DUF2806 domain-containing protein [Bibersteinia trehalosi]|uniref:DUF2806 domain-containing protein n=1 Tax=Bibersteinia trehalosi TaxID=47735 RepID=A0A3R8LA68_BIBTR|nr:DUF2806 domain-containing protein [Bibersteinia trehalosi]RRN00426.1 DUF2806 domain-containing protein [Bibersteinia trehalosi]